MTPSTALVESYPDNDVRPNEVTTHQSAAQSPKRENMIKLSTTIGESETRGLDEQTSGCNKPV
jgi:hypothetical protein